MKKTFHFAKANILKHKSAVATLFVIIMIMSALTTVGLSLILDVERDFVAGTDRLNSLHSLFVMTKDQYLPSFEGIIKDDPRISQYEIGEVLFTDNMKLNYGGEIDIGVIILNIDRPMSISAPKITKQDISIPREKAIYLPVFAESLGYKIGDPFKIQYRNRLFALTVAGFFESNEYSLATGLMLKFFAPDACYESLAQYIGRSVWITTRCFDPNDCTQFVKDFAGQIDIELTYFNTGDGVFVVDWVTVYNSAITPIMIISTIILIFTILIALIALMVTRFRVANNIESAMHEIGAMKSSGYTSGQIIACYLVEYGIVSLFAALIGVIIPVPVFIFIRQTLTFMTGVTWTLDVNWAAGLLAALGIVIILMVMIAHSCHRIKKMPPVDALRGEAAANSFRRNFFPLHRGAWNVQTRLGLKNMFAYSRFYVMFFAVITGISLALTLGAAMYQNFALDDTAFMEMVGVEVSDVKLNVSRHIDANALEAELKELPEVRHTSMLDWISFKVDEVEVMGFVSNDYSQLELMSTHDGRFPRFDNEVAIPKKLADQLGKVIGDSVKIKANSVSLDYIITGFFSTVTNSGDVCQILLEGYQKLDPNYRRSSINVYLNDGVTVDAFSEIATQKYGVVNMYRQEEDGRFAAAKARAEEKISYYLHYYDIDSVEYAVIYDGEIILSGSSGAYQIERIENLAELLKSQVGTYSSALIIVTQMVALVSVIIILLILSMMVRQIVTKRRRELGILKSCGFTTKQLARQLAISFLPCAAAGILVGCFFGAALVNPSFTAMFAFSGVYNANIYANPFLTAVLGVIVLLFTFAVANISAMRIRHISVYELISE